MSNQRSERPGLIFCLAHAAATRSATLKTKNPISCPSYYCYSGPVARLQYPLSMSLSPACTRCSARLLPLPQRSELAMATSFRPFACEASCPSHATIEGLLTLPPTSEPSQGAPSESTDQDEEFYDVELADPSPTASSLYSLTHGPLSSASSCTSRTSRSYLLLGSTSSDTSPFSPAPGLQVSAESPLHHSECIRSFLSKLSCGITNLEMAFSAMRVSSVPLAPTESSFSRAEKSMLSELQTLSNLQMRLHSLILQHEFGKKENHSSKTFASQPMGVDADRKDAMLRSYEGIITRFHDEISQKNATVEALKQTLAKSILKGEKLEGRIKALEAKLSRVPELSDLLSIRMQATVLSDQNMY